MSESSTTPTAPPLGAGLSRTVPRVVTLLLILGWYMPPVLGWLAALVVILSEDRWSRRDRMVAIGWSVGGVAVAVATLFAVRGGPAATAGIVAVFAVPGLVNLFVADFLRRRWGSGAAATRHVAAEV